ncbi:MAG TPA: metal ABC transporter ATP-binding protein [bacterium]|nr:metal ABC transporter ATP-binding protein [bacterium]
MLTRRNGQLHRPGSGAAALQGSPPLLEMRGVTCGYGPTPVLHDINLSIAEGQLAGIVGPSGAGKSTLLRAILGQVEMHRGVISVMGEPVRGRPPGAIGYVPQLETIDWNFPVTVEEVVLMGRAASSGPWPWPSRADRHAMSELLDRLGMLPFARRQIRDLSGGQQQRVFLARALMRNPRLLLLDEPTTGVDIKTRHEVLHLLRELHQSGVTILLTTHDLNAVATHLPHVICLNHTVIAQGPPTEVFRDETLSRTYGAEMVVVRRGSLVLVADRLTSEGEPADAHALQDAIAVSPADGVVPATRAAGRGPLPRSDG